MAEIILLIQEMIEQIEEIFKGTLENQFSTTSDHTTLLSTIDKILAISSDGFELPTYEQSKHILQMIRILQKERRHNFK